jgi:hypothetical protein
MKRIINEPWFGKKSIGWGLTPITWQGWVVTLLLILIIILDISYFHKSIIGIIILFMAIIGYILIAFLTSEKPDTKI